MMESTQRLRLHFRTLGILRRGFMSVELIGPSLPAAPDTIQLIDVFISEIPVSLISPSLRQPNTDLDVTVVGRDNIIDVRPYSQEA